MMDGVDTHANVSLNSALFNGDVLLVQRDDDLDRI
jgi:hypothetical protein